MRLRAGLPGLLLGLLLAGCQTTDVAPAASATAALEDDEQRLWARAREEQEAIERSGFLVRQPALEAYLDGLLAQLQTRPLGAGGQLHAHVVVDPTLNAFALPDGTIYIHSGLLTRLENEAQLATVLAHELTHSTHRHALKNIRNLKNQTGFYASLTMSTGGMGGLLGLLGAASSISGYSQELEREADATGFRQLRLVGYDPQESPKVFRTLLAESRRSKIKEPYFFGSHPRLSERIASYEELVAALPPAQRQGRVGAAEFHAAIAPVYALNAGAALHAGDFEGALDSARRRLAQAADDAPAQLVLAETFRRRAQGQDLAEALRLYQALATRPDAPAEAHRGLGLLLLKTDKPAAAAAFRRYLQNKPDAADRGHIETYLRQCESSSS